jgi:hypothetical protein
MKSLKQSIQSYQTTKGKPMDWLRYHHNTPYDIKLTMIAKKAGVRRCEMTAVWDCLLDYASQHLYRGCVDGINLELIAFSQDIEIETVETIVKHLETNAVIVDGFLTAWEARQVERERNEKTTSTERVRLYREKKKAEKQGNPTILDKTKPLCNDMKHRETPRNAPDKIRLDKNKDISYEISSVTAFAETENYKNHDLIGNQPEKPSKASKSTKQSPENQPETTDRGGMASDAKTSKPATYPPDFERFWNAYPSDRRREKPCALKAWRQALKQAPPEEIMAGLAEYATSKQVLDGFSCYPAKWLKNQRWLEEHQPASPQQPQGNPQNAYGKSQQPPQRPNGGYQPYPNKAEQFNAVTAKHVAKYQAEHDAMLAANAAEA